MIWCIMTYIIAYVKTQKNKIHNPLCQTYSPTMTPVALAEFKGS